MTVTPPHAHVLLDYFSVFICSFIFIYVSVVLNKCVKKREASVSVRGPPGATGVSGLTPAVRAAGRFTATKTAAAAPSASLFRV